MKASGELRRFFRATYDEFRSVVHILFFDLSYCLKSLIFPIFNRVQDVLLLVWLWWIAETSAPWMGDVGTGGYARSGTLLYGLIKA